MRTKPPVGGTVFNFPTASVIFTEPTPRALVGHHLPELPGGDQFHGFGAEDGAKRAVEIRWAAAPLQVPQDASAGLLAGALLDFRSHHGGDAAQPGLAVGNLFASSNELAALFSRPFGRR